MSKTLAVAFAVASIALAAAAPAQAATRSVDIHAELFADRCFDQGGVISDASPNFVCQTPETVVSCSFVTLNNAWCEWQGIDGQVAVNRIIGMQAAVTIEGSGGVPAGKGGGGGGIDVPDLPWNNGGGGGIKVPDLPIKWK